MPSIDSATQALSNVRDAMKGALLQRDAEVDTALTALLAGEHLLLLGPPGTAKSMLGELISEALEARTFTRLMTKHSVPEELFGPYSLSALEEDRYERKIDGYLPTAEVAVLDEIWKANSAILNALLTILNERRFDNGVERIDCPLEFALGMSNELPADDSLQALYDRFLLRRWVTPIDDDAQFLDMLCMGARAPMPKLSRAELAVLRQAVATIEVPETVLEIVVKIRRALIVKGIQPSDRRYRKAIKLVCASAVLRGSTTASTKDLLVLSDVLWDNPEDAGSVAATVIELASPALREATRLLEAAEELYVRAGQPDESLKVQEAFAARKFIKDAVEGLVPQVESSPEIQVVIDDLESMQQTIVRRINKEMGL